MTEQVAQAFQTLEAFHRVVGPVSFCSWADYRATVIATLKISGDVLDAMARLGHFTATKNSVRFAA